MGAPSTKNPAKPDRASWAERDLGNVNASHLTDLEDDARRRLAAKLAASAGLLVAVASVMVVVALGDGERA